jgi:hypothetical protein
MAPLTAALVAACKLLLWHLAQPAAYALIVLALWAQLGRALRVMCALLMVREGWYALMALLAAWVSPACLLASPWAEEKVSWKLTYILAPETFLAMVLAYGGGPSGYEWVGGIGEFGLWGSWALDVLGIAAFVTALATGAPAALSVALGVISASLVAVLYGIYNGWN